MDFRKNSVKVPEAHEAITYLNGRCDLAAPRGIPAEHFTPYLMIRKAFLMQVQPDQHAEYARRHEEIWPDLAEVLKSHGVSNYSIFLDPATSRLFGYAEIESEELWASIGATPACQRWWAYMRDIMPSNPDNSPIASSLTEVFHLA